MLKSRGTFVIAVLAVASLTFASALYDAKSDVIMADAKTFQKLVLDTDHTVIVEFFAPWCGHCKNLAPIYDKLATKLKGLVKVVAVDADAERAIGGQYGVQGFPTIKVFPGGKKNKKTPVDYSGPRTAKDMADFALSKMVSFVEPVASVADATSGKYDVLVFLSKKQTPPMLKALSIDFKDKLKIGEVHEKSKDVVSEFGVSAFPSVVFIAADGSRSVFDGELKQKELSKAFKELSSKKGNTNTNGNAKAKADDEEEERQQQQQQQQATANIEVPASEVIYLESQEAFESQCLTKKGLCFITFLDPLEKEDTEKFTKVLEEVRKDKASLKLFHFFWADGTRLTEEFQRKLVVPGGFPSAVIISPSKQRAGAYVGSFTKSDLSKGLDKVVRGTLKTNPYDALPVLLGPPVEMSADNDASDDLPHDEV
eukprot:ANDGO_06464.mRNA.1 Putative protein disulfide-isomerase DDB_G0275025